MIMKNLLNKKFSVVFLTVAIALLMSSCLKNNKYYVDFGDYAPNVELPLAATNVNNPFAVSYDVADTPATFYVVVNYASMNKPTKPVKVTIAIDQAYLDQYNADQTAADPDYEPFDLMPDSTYSIESMTGTIEPGKRQVWIPVKVYTSKMDASHSYILPVTITSADVKISNWNHLLANIGAKNGYDGVYKVAGQFIHPAYGNQIWDYSAGITQELVTAGPKSVWMSPTKTPAVQFGVELDITVNADNSLTETFNGNPTATPNTDHYDPATRTFYVSGSYSGTRFYKATLVYVKPR